MAETIRIFIVPPVEGSPVEFRVDGPNDAQSVLKWLESEFGDGSLRDPSKRPVLSDPSHKLEGGDYQYRVKPVEPRAEQPLGEHLQQYHGVNTKLEYLVCKFREMYQKARPALPGYRGRLPSTLRSLAHAFVREVMGHDGVTYPVDLGRQVELICRSHMVRAAIFFFAKIERNFITSSGNDTGLTRSLALMALIGAPGTGKTTALTELVHLMREHIDKHPQDCMTIIMNATGQREEGSAERTLQRLRRSVTEGKELVCWLRLDKDASLLALELEGPGPENTLALRLLYGFLTYFDSLDGPQSPVGTYQEFLQSLDRRVRGELTPEDAFAFLDDMTDQTPDTPRAVFVHADEFNAARGPFPNDVPGGEDGVERSWAQRLMSTLIQYTAHQPTRNRLVLAVLGTSRHSVATLAGTATPRSEIAPLPLNAPLVRDVQHFLRGIWGRVLLTVGGMERSCQAVEDDESVVVRLASWVGGNFRLMAWMLELFGGAKTVYDHDSWQAEELAEWLCAERGHPAVKSVLEALRGGMEGQGWFDKLGTLEVPVKLAILQRAIAHARTGVTVQLRAPVLRNHPRITWGDLLNEGLIQPVFLVEVTDDERRKRPIVRVAESPVRSPVVEARGSEAWHDIARHGDLPDFSDERALGPSGGPGLQPPASPATGAAVEPVGPSELQSPATPAAGAAGEVAPPRTSPVMETVTALGYRRVIDPSANLSAAEITIDLAPAVMAGLWRRTGNLDMSPLAETVYQESSAKKERVDLFCMMHPMYLRRKELGMSYCRLVEVVRAGWLPPWAAALRVELPEPCVLENIAYFQGQLKPDFFPNVRAVAHAASLYKEGGSWPDLVKRAQQAGLSRPAVGVIAADNYGTDSLLFLKLKSALALGDEFLDLFLQSKYTMGVTTQTFPYALAQTKKDTGRHHITAGKAPRVPELWGPEEPRPAKRVTLPRLAGERGEQQRRRDPDQGFFPGGTMAEFEAAVLDAPEARLEAWEGQLEKLGIQPPKCPHPFLCCFVTDHTMLSKEHRRLRVLSLAGHPYASRMVFIDKAQQKTFHGTAIDTQRNLAKLQDNWAQ